MPRASILALVLVLIGALLLVGGPTTRADENQAKKADERPKVCSDEQAAEVLSAFREAYKAKGLRGDDKISQRDYAMRELKKAQHPDVVAELGRISRGGDDILCMLALIYLGEQRALPHLAGQHVIKAMNRNKKDEVLLMTGLQSLGDLKYLGAREEISALLKHKSYIVKRAAIAAVGRTLDARLMADVLKLIGIKTDTEPPKGEKADSGGQPEVTEEGYSWDGVEVTYDTGAPGTHDQEMAERIGREQLAANRAAAEAAHQQSSGRGGDGMGGSGGRGGQARSPDELIPAILKMLKALTGGDFDNPGQIRPWLQRNRKAFDHNLKVLDVRERKQRAGEA